MLVIGMHRSGTSAVGLLAEALGLRSVMGSPLPANAGNPRGFAEHAEVTALDDDLMRLLGSRWDSPPTLTPRQLDAFWAAVPGIEVETWRERIQLPWSADQGWFVKDPRMCFLVGAWDRIALRRLPVVLCVRDPREAALSLSLRDGISPTAGLVIWLAHVRAAAAAASDRPALVVDYGRLLADPVATAGALSDFATACTGVATKAPAEAAASIEPQLRRAVGADLDPSLDALLEPAMAMWSALAVHHGESPAQATTDYALPRLADDILGLLADLGTLRDALAGQAATIEDARARVEDARARVEEAVRSSSPTHPADESERLLAEVVGSRRYRVMMAALRPFDRTRDRLR